MRSELPNAKVILLSPSGKRFDQRCAHKFSLESELILICGRYEGVDQRVSDMVVDEEISIGDFVLMGGEVAAMAVVEATSRLLENVLGNSASLVNESFEISSGEGPLLEGPQYTRPAEFRGVKVPDILFSGDHAKIAAWRLERARERTAKMRPDLRSK